MGGTIAITFDLEWATPVVLEDLRDLLQTFDVRTTLFSTHDDGLVWPRHERALHPNFLVEDKNEAEVLEELADIYPLATGIRSHSLYIHGKLRSLYPRFNIEYESNYSMFGCQDVQPFTMVDGTVQFPITFSDGGWLTLRSRGIGSPDPSDLIGWSGFHTFLFHPPHIAFNTPSAEFYESNRDLLWDPEADLEKARAEGPGSRDFLIELLSLMESQGIQGELLGDIAPSIQEGSSWK